jgi:hypothetical protein
MLPDSLPKSCPLQCHYSYGIMNPYSTCISSVSASLFLCMCRYFRVLYRASLLHASCYAIKLSILMWMKWSFLNFSNSQCAYLMKLQSQCPSRGSKCVNGSQWSKYRVNKYNADDHNNFLLKSQWICMPVWSNYFFQFVELKLYYLWW